MCLTSDNDSRRAECWVIFLGILALLVSLGVAAPMFILTYPGDECLLFVSVRGEALIYGNPAGCHFVASSHCTIIFLGLLILAFGRARKGFINRRQTNEAGSNKSLRGTQDGIAFGQSHYSIDQGSYFRFSKTYTSKAIILTGLVAVYSVVTALVAISGYLTTCNELHYETRRQVYGRTTLGSPIRTLNIQCWSLFRDVDFHTRFHFDHYEFSGQWHGQYRGNNHGRVHHYTTNHEHLIDVALALELSLSCTWIASALWITVVSLMISLRKRQKMLQRRELAESLEDARIYASSRQLDPSQNIMMQPQPLDQMSMISNQSSVLSQKPSHFSGVSTSPNPTGIQNQQLSSSQLSHHRHQQQHQQASASPVPVILQQQMLTQQQMLDQQMLQMQQMQQMASQQQQQNGVQYVQLSNGLLVPVNSFTPSPQPPPPQQQQQQPFVMVANSPQQQQQLSNSLPTVSKKATSGGDKHDYSSIEEAFPNGKNAQKKQVHMSQGAGLKCSKI